MDGRARRGGREKGGEVVVGESSDKTGYTVQTKVIWQTIRMLQPRGVGSVVILGVRGRGEKEDTK